MTGGAGPAVRATDGTADRPSTSDDVSRRDFAIMGGLGFASGLPLPLSGFTLGLWLSESGLSLHTIGLAGMVGLPYSLKFLWAPALDRIRPPPLLAALGRRRGWLLAIQALLVIAVLALAASDPRHAPQATFAAALVLAFLSATQDIVIDAWRIEIFPQSRQGSALAAYVWGYRAALLAANAGAIRLASTLGWHGTYTVMAALAGGGMLMTLLAREAAPAPPTAPTGTTRAPHWRGLVEPLRDLLSRAHAMTALGFVVLFNLGEALAGVMLPPYYRALHYSRDAIAAANVPSLFAALAGVAAGGWLVRRIGVGRALVLTGFIQMAAILIYLALSYAGGSVPALIGTVSTEAFVGGLASAAFLAFLSGLCRREFAAGQYALLSSLAAVPLRFLSGASGFLAQAAGWRLFYALSTLAALPAMLLMLRLLRTGATRESGAAPLDAPG